MDESECEYEFGRMLESVSFNAPPPLLLFLLFSLPQTHSVRARGAARAEAPSASSSVALRGGMAGNDKGVEREKK